jgi:hypothetical protein
VVKQIGGHKNAYSLTAEKLGYANVQMVYNWPHEISRSLMASIILRMRAGQIDVPASWVKYSKRRP